MEYQLCLHGLKHFYETESISLPLILLLFFFIAQSCVSNAQTPQMKILGTTVPSEQKAVSLKSLHIEVQVYGNIATTVMTMSFMNTSSRVLEGELTFPMPDGVSISGYALDVNGKMREAVPVEKAKAAEVFESVEHRRVDPGLLEKVEGNNFRTRIYPFPAGGSRTVKLLMKKNFIFPLSSNLVTVYHWIIKMLFLNSL